MMVQTGAHRGSADEIRAQLATLQQRQADRDAVDGEPEREATEKQEAFNIFRDAFERAVSGGGLGKTYEVEMSATVNGYGTSMLAMRIHQWPTVGVVVPEAAPVAVTETVPPASDDAQTGAAPQDAGEGDETGGAS